MNEDNIRQLKEKIYARVDQLEDETALQMLEEAITVYTSPTRQDILDELTADQRQRLEESIQQANDGKIFMNEEVKRLARTWGSG